MAGEIKHKWNGTILTITSDSGTSSADLKGEKGDDGIRGPQGATGFTIGADGSIDTSGFATMEYVDNAVSNVNVNSSGLTYMQILALHEMFKVCAYTKSNIANEYNAFLNAFGLTENENPKPDAPEVTGYKVTNNLTNVTNSNSATTASGFYSAYLSAADGYVINVVITMGGIDITKDVYTEDQRILITNVTGDIVITAIAELATASVLYQLANTPRVVNADLYEDTGLAFGSATANGYTKAWTMVAKVSNVTAGTLWCVNGDKGLRSYYENRWNGAAGKNTAHLTTNICATATRPSVTQANPNEIRIVITKDAMSDKTATVHYFSYDGEMVSEQLVGTYGQFNGSVYAGNMMIGGQTAADFVGTINEFTIYEGVAAEDQIKSYLGVA